MPEGAYFESHVAVQIPFNQRDRISQLAKIYHAHISRNAFKRYAETEVVMLTLRHHTGDLEDFNDSRDLLVSGLRLSGFTVDKIITEFAWHDTKQNHDAAWLQA